MSRNKHEVFRVKRGISCLGLLRLRSQRSLLTIIAFTLLLTATAFAQNEVIIGFGTSDQYYPLDRSFIYSTHEAIYLASEINITGNITHIAYYKDAGSNITAIESVRIFMKHTTATTLASGTCDSTDGFTRVFAGSFTNTAQPAWMEVALSPQFNYNGTDNLQILIFKGRQAKLTTASQIPKYRYTTTSPNYRTRQLSDSLSQPSSLTQNYYRPNIRIKFPLPSNEVIIGTGTSTQLFPLDRSQLYSTHEVIYLASEINLTGYITHISYYRAGGTNITAIESVRIFMKHTTATTLATGPCDSTDGFTRVFAGSFTNNTTEGWVINELTTPFNYNGTDNLQILIFKGYQATLTTAARPLWRYTTTSPNRTRQASGASAPSSLTETSYRPNIRLKFPVPNDVAVTDVNFSPMPAIPADSVIITARIKNQGSNTKDTIPMYYRTPDKGLVGPETCFVSLALGQSTDFSFTAKYYAASAGTYAVKCSTGLVDDFLGNNTFTKNLRVYPALSGTKYVGVGGDYITIDSALTKHPNSWKNSAITGNVTFLLTDATYPSETYPLICTIPGGYKNGNWTLTIKPSATKSQPLIEGFSGTAIFDLKGINRLTIDSLVISNTGDGSAVRFILGASYNTIKNSTLKSVIISTSKGVAYFATAGATGNNNNTIQYCDITMGATKPLLCVFAYGTGATPNDSNKIKNCRIFDFGGTNVQGGISVGNGMTNTLISDNLIYQTSGTAGTTVYGIQLTDGATGTIIERNKIYDLTSTGATPTIIGIRFPSNLNPNVTETIRNNFIYLGANTPNDATVQGIYDLSSNIYTLNIFYNSIYIGGTGVSSGTTGALVKNGPTNWNLKNNIAYNARSGGTGKHYAIQFITTTGTLSLNNNDYFVDGISGVLGRWGANDQTTLDAWKTASGKDTNSISVDPDFRSATDLHIDSLSVNVDRKGTPIAGITTDFDTLPRNANWPDIGADEYLSSPPVGVSLISPSHNATNVNLYGNLVWNKTARAEYYDVYLEANNPNPTNLVSSLQTETTYTYPPPTLSTGTDYYWKVVAWNDTNNLGKGQSATSSIYKFTTGTPPNPPSSLTLDEITTNSMVLEWSDTDDELGFYIRRDVSPDGPFPKVDSVGADVLTYGASGLTPNTHYYWRVTAYNANGESDFIAADTWTLAEVPGAPTLSESSYSTMKVVIDTAGNPTGTQFAVRVDDGTKAPRFLNYTTGNLQTSEHWGTYANFGGASGIKVKCLASGITYTFDVKARNGATPPVPTGYGPDSAQATLPPFSFPLAEDFETAGFPPAGWDSVTTNFFTGAHAQFSKVQYGNFPICSPYSGDSMVKFNSTDAGNMNRARLWTPPIDLTTANLPMFYFYMYHNITGPDSLGIEVSTDFGATWIQLDKYPLLASPSGWQKHTISLNSYNNDTVMIAFHGYSHSGMNIYFDNVNITPYRDVAVTAIVRPYEAKLNEQKRIEFQPHVTVSNNSGQTEDIPVHAEILPLYFKEDFTGTTFPPEGWTRFNFDLGNQWERTTTYYNSPPAGAYSSSGISNNDWLITPQISVNAGDSLVFYWDPLGTAGMEPVVDSMRVRVSTTTLDTSAFTIISKVGGTGATMRRKAINLNSYAGQNVYMAFQHYYSEAGIAIDDINIKPLPFWTADTIVEGIEPGKEPAEAYFEPFTPLDHGNFTFKAYTTLPEDMNPDNNLRTRNFTVDPITLILSEPSNGVVTNNLMPHFAWYEVTGATQYHWQIASDSLFATIQYEQDGLGLSFDPSTPLPEGTPLYWHVRAEVPGTPDPYSAFRKLTIDTTGPVPPALILPTDNIYDNTPEFVWNDNPDADSFNLVVIGPTKDEISITTAETTYTHVEPLANGGYTWKVRGKDVYGNWGDFTDPSFEFTIIPPATPTLIAPPNNDTFKLQTPIFVWNLSADADSFNLVYNGPLKDEVSVMTKDTTYTPGADLAEGNYTWHVRAKDEYGNYGYFSTEWAFRIDITGPAAPTLISPIDSALITTETTTLLWNDVVDRDSFHIVCGASDADYYTAGDTTYTLTLGRGTYNWKVQGKDAYGNWGPFSEQRTLFVTVTWVQKESLPNFIKDGGALVKVPGEKSGDKLYALRGSKSNQFYMYDAGWTAEETLQFGYKWPLAVPPKINKKYPGKGAALCFDGDNTIYATKGNSTWEFWAYTISDSTWTAKAFVPSTQKLKGGTSIAYKDGLVYLLAGAQKKDNFNNFFAYDPDSDYVGSTTAWQTLTGPPLTPPATGKAKPFKDGSAISVIGDTIYALKGGDKYNFFYAYDITGGAWTEIESIPLIHPQLGKKNKVGDGGAMTTDGTILYVIKGKGKQDFWKYTPGETGVWAPLETIPRVGVAFKKSVPKTGAALAYANSAVWLLKGNKTSEFWQHVPYKEKSKVKNQMSKAITNTQEELTLKQVQGDRLLDVTPNPFAKLTTIHYTVPVSGKVSLKLYNATGRLIKTLNNSYHNAGTYTVNLSAKNFAKGIYFLRYNDNTNQKEIKLIVE